MNDAIRQACETTHTNARITAGDLAGLCALLPAEPLAVKLGSIARGIDPGSAMQIAAAHLRQLVRNVDALTAPEPEKPTEGE